MLLNAALRQIGFARRYFQIKLPRCASATVRLKSTRVPPINSKLSYRYGISSHPLLGCTLGELVDAAADNEGDKIALISCHQGIQKTFSQFKTDVDGLAAGLLSLGLKKGDRVGCWSPNCYEWMVIQFATAKAGLALVTLNPAFKKNEIEYCLKKVNVSSMVISDNFKTQDYYGMVSELIPELPNSKPGLLHTSRFPELKNVIILSENTKPGTITYKDVLTSSGSEAINLLHTIEKSISFDDPVNIQFTSGTTGEPKAATISHHNIINNAFFVSKRQNYNKETDIICVPVPLFHTFGCVIGNSICMVATMTAVYPAPSFDPLKTLEAIAKHRCTHVYGTPTMFIDIINHPDLKKFDVSSMKGGLMGGSPCLEDIMRSAVKELNMKNIGIAYGTTENSPVITMVPSTDPLENRVKYVGPPLDHVEVKIIDDKGKTVPINTLGELCSRGHITFLGYWDDKAKTDEIMDSAKWYHTGDIAVMNEDGYIAVSGRIKDMIIRGGENIYPTEIEQFLHEHPDLIEVQVFGVPDKRMGEEVCAWIKLKENSNITKKDVLDYCKGKISHFKIPRYIYFVKDFPKTTSGKIQKFRMKEETIKMLENHK